MRNRIKLATTTTLIALVGAALSQPAMALDFQSILQSLSGGISGWTDLDARESEISNQINVSVNAGQLTAAEGDSFKAELARISQVEAQIKGSGRRLSATESMSFTNSLNNLTTRIQSTTYNRPTGSTINTGSTLTTSTVGTVSGAAVGALRTQLVGQVMTAMNAGQLTQSEAANLRRDLDHNSEIENQFNNSASAGMITAAQAQILSDDLQRIQLSINQQVTTGQSYPSQLNAHRNAIEATIANGLSARTLNVNQASDFRRDLARITNMQSRFASSGGMTANEVYVIGGQLDALSSRIDYQIAQTPDWRVRPTGQSSATIDARQMQLSTKINDGLNSGRITAQVAAELNRELQHIAMIEAAYQSHRRGLTLAQVQTISAQLDDLNARVDQRGVGSRRHTREWTY